MTTLPLGRVTFTDCANVTPTPATSKVTSTPFQYVRLRILMGQYYQSLQRELRPLL